MSYTFGAATGDDVTSAALAIATFGDNCSDLVAGWFYPTTLTAGRKYWGSGATIGAEVDTTTSEIRMRTDNTTDGQWLTSGAGITINKWWFIAWLSATENTTVAGAWRVWVGDGEQPPVEVTVTNPTVRSGNYTASSTLTAGNAGNAGTVAFQGDIACLTHIKQNQPFSSNPLIRGASGVIENSEAENTYQRWVFPLWNGNPDASYFQGSANIDASIAHIDFSQNPVSALLRGSTVATSYSPALTVSGATYSQSEPPRKPPFDWHMRYPKARR